jgi:dephospho-CoA kinase
LGLTGGIASGKSTTAELFRQQNIPVIDADLLVKKIYKKKETFDFIKNNFPEVIENKNINFSRLREMAFTRPEIKKRLEDFIYAHLPTEFSKAYQALAPSPFIVYDVPLLFEKHLDQLIDTSLCVYSQRSLQLERLMKRDGVEQILAEKMLDQQMNIEEKKLKANIVIQNTGSLEQLLGDFRRIFLELTT